MATPTVRQAARGRGSVGAALVLAAMLLCAACASTPPRPEPMKLALAVEARPTLNPDDKGRAAPVLVRLYELKTEGAFLNADYFSLDEKDRTVLQQDLLVRDEFILRPGETRDIARTLQPETRALGVLVGYRDLGHATWRAVHRLPPAAEAAWYRSMVPARKVALSVVLDQQTLTIFKAD